MPSKEKNILLIDDDIFILEIYSLQFRKEGFEILAVENAKKAFELLEKGEKPDLILLDLILPETQGLEFLEKLRKDFPGVKAPVVILSNVGQQDSIERARSLGVVDYIIKANHTPSEVVEKVRLILKESGSV